MQDAKDQVASVFDRARQSGAAAGTEEDLDTSGPFRGTGRTLAGGTAEVSTCSRDARSGFRNFSWVQTQGNNILFALKGVLLGIMAHCRQAGRSTMSSRSTATASSQLVTGLPGVWTTPPTSGLLRASLG